MKIILNHWLQSLLLFSPAKFKTFLIFSINRFFLACKTVLRHFGILVAIDLVLLLVFGNVIFKILHLPTPPTNFHISMSMITVILLIEVNWFILSTIMLLFIRKKDIAEPLIYLKQMFFAYLQLLLLFYLLFFVCMTILISFGITKIPQFPWIFTASHTILKLLIIFYWLDSSMTLKDCFFSCEKAVNCFVYNLPVFLFLLAIFWGFDIGIKALFWKSAKAIDLNSVALICRTEHLIKACPAQTTLLKFLLFRYVIFFIKNIWTSFVFVFYDQKKGSTYSTSCLDALQNVQPPL
jgi:hypothetical protein